MLHSCFHGAETEITSRLQSQDFFAHEYCNLVYDLHTLPPALNTAKKAVTDSMDLSKATATGCPAWSVVDFRIGQLCNFADGSAEPQELSLAALVSRQTAARRRQPA